MGRVDLTPEQEAVLAAASSDARLVYLDAWLDHLEALLGAALTAFADSQPLTEIPAPPPLPEGAAAETGLGALITEHVLSADEALLVTLALAPLVRPDLFDRVVSSTPAQNRDLEILGGMRGKTHRGMLPTGDTALFLLAGFDTPARLHWQGYLTGGGLLIQRQVLRLAPPEGNDPPMSGQLMVAPDMAGLILTGQFQIPALSSSFPAQKLNTGLTWEDLVLPAQTMAQVNELIAWQENKSTVLEDWGLGRRLRPGCRALFNGPPGTGKTLTATLIGAQIGHDVLRVDLSAVVSKYIGETEKNLAALFDQAEYKDWLLFFDEADALFGKRTATKEAKDRYANQEIAFLLQRIETFSGMIVLSSNLLGNVDPAFSRRFEHIVFFPPPRAGERLKLWQQAIPDQLALDPALDLRAIAEEYELTGASILNVVRHAALQAATRSDATLARVDIDQGIRRELAKEGRSR